MMRAIANRAYKAAAGLGIVIAAALLLTPISLQAEPIAEHDVTAAVETWVRHVTADARPDAGIESLEPYEVDGEAVAYIAHLAGGGFCLCGGDDQVLPVYLYNPTGTYDPGNPNYQFILGEIASRLAKLEKAVAQRDAVLETYEPALAERLMLWDDLIAGVVPEGGAAEGDRADPTSMELPVTSWWHQGSPFNDQTPILTPGSDEHCAVGCVATASAQIMYYWKWPNTGVGSGSVGYDYRYRSTWDYEPLAVNPQLDPNWAGGGRLEWVSTSGGQLRMKGYWDGSLYGGARNHDEDATYRAALENLWNRMPGYTTTYSANFGATTYNWSILQDEHSDPPGSGDIEAAELSYQAGIALGMNYGIWGSGSHTSVAASALPDHFRYDTDTVFGGTNVNTMVTDIQWYRPVQLGGQGENGGHSWVVCGYNKGTSPWQFLMNMGWGGGSTEWYSVDQVFPNEQGHTTRIAPKDVVKFVGGSAGGDGTPSSPYWNLNAALTDAADGTTLVFKAGSTHTYPATSLTIDWPLTLKGHDVIIQVQ